MSKYSMVHEGKVLDWMFVRHNQADSPAYNFYAGEILLGQIFKMRKSWTLVSTIPGVQVRHTAGFASRNNAATHAVEIFKCPTRIGSK